MINVLFAAAIMLLPIQADHLVSTNVTMVASDPWDTINKAPLPTEYQKMFPLDPSIASWSGLWRGRWEGTLDSYIRITGSRGEGGKVTAFYSWGTNQVVKKAGFEVIGGLITDQTAIFSLGQHYTFVLTKTNNGELDGIFYTPLTGNPSRGIFSKVAD
jgi:hypothetical protein